MVLLGAEKEGASTRPHLLFFFEKFAGALHSHLREEAREFEFRLQTDITRNKLHDSIFIHRV
jgi:hypothetical protein